MAAKRIASSENPTPPGRDGRSAELGAVQRAIAGAFSSGEIISVGVLNLVTSTLITALQGVKDVGAEVGSVGVAAVRGSIRAASDIGADLGMVTKGAIKGTLRATQEIGGDVAVMARSATQGAVKTTADLGGDVAKTARRAVEAVEPPVAPSARR